MCKSTALSYAQGSIRLVWLDFDALRPALEPLALHVDEMLRLALKGAADAFAARRELTSLKKLFLHLYEEVLAMPPTPSVGPSFIPITLMRVVRLSARRCAQGRALERDLAQIATHERADIVHVSGAGGDRGDGGAGGEGEGEGGGEGGGGGGGGEGAPFHHGQRYAEVARALAEHRGVVRACGDARLIVKTLCLLPRCPADGDGTSHVDRLRELPVGLATHAELQRGNAVGTQPTVAPASTPTTAPPAAPPAAPPSTPTTATTAPPPTTAPPTAPTTAPPSGVLSAALSAAVATPSAKLRGHDALLTATDSERSAAVSSIISLVLLARGAAKAESMRQEARATAAALHRLASQCAASASAPPSASAQSTSASADERAAACARDRHHRYLAAAAPLLAVTAAALELAASSSADSARVFVSGDCAHAADRVFASDLPSLALLRNDLYATARRVVATHQPALYEAVRDAAAPRRPWTFAGRARCQVCERSLAALWLSTASVCVVCLATRTPRDGCMRRGKACLGSLSWCVHASRCFACDLGAPACAACALARGGGEDVMARALAEPPLSHLFLDFDRTLASTKRGESPRAKGTPADPFAPHTVDPDLAALCAGAAPCEVHVVTRNSHTADIAAFLAARGAAVPLEHIHHVGKGASKADVVLAATAADDAALIVDDDLRELVSHPSLMALRPNLERLIFVRASGVQCW